MQNCKCYVYPYFRLTGQCKTRKCHFRDSNGKGYGFLYFFFNKWKQQIWIYDRLFNHWAELKKSQVANFWDTLVESNRENLFFSRDFSIRGEILIDIWSGTILTNILSQMDKGTWWNVTFNETWCKTYTWNPNVSIFHNVDVLVMIKVKLIVTLCCY